MHSFYTVSSFLGEKFEDQLLLLGQDLRASLHSTYSQVKLMRQRIKQMKSDMATAATDVCRFKTQRANLEAVMAKLKVDYVMELRFLSISSIFGSVLLACNCLTFTCNLWACTWSLLSRNRHMLL